MAETCYSATNTGGDGDHSRRVTEGSAGPSFRAPLNRHCARSAEPRPPPPEEDPMASNEPVTIPALQQMKRDGKKSVGVVAWDYQIARIAERAGVDFVSVGDSVGVNLWGHSNPLEVTLEEILVCCKAVRRGVTRALVSCDVPFGPVQEGIDAALRAAIRLVKEGGADMVKVDAAADFPDAVKALTRAGIPVFAQFGLTPQTALKYGVPYSTQNSPGAQAASAAAPGSTAACAWHIPRSAMPSAGSTPRPTLMSTAPRLRSPPSRR